MCVHLSQCGAKFGKFKDGSDPSVSPLPEYNMEVKCMDPGLPICVFDPTLSVAGNVNGDSTLAYEKNEGLDCYDDNDCKGDEEGTSGLNFAWSTAAGYTKCGKFLTTKYDVVIAKKCVHPDTCDKPCQGGNGQYWVTCGTVYEYIRPEEVVGITFGVIGSVIYCMFIICLCVVYKRTK